VISFEEWCDFLLFLPHKTTMKSIFLYYRNVMQPTDSGDAIVVPVTPGNPKDKFASMPVNLDNSFVDCNHLHYLF
jgi:hypothetical protein